MNNQLKMENSTGGGGPRFLDLTIADPKLGNKLQCTTTQPFFRSNCG